MRFALPVDSPARSAWVSGLRCRYLDGTLFDQGPIEDDRVDRVLHDTFPDLHLMYDN